MPLVKNRLATGALLALGTQVQAWPTATALWPRQVTATEMVEGTPRYLQGTLQVDQACTDGNPDMWNNTDEYFASWWKSNSEATNWAVELGSSWGLGQTFRCGLPNTCDAPICADLTEGTDTFHAYKVLESVSNLNNYLNKLREALWLSNTQYATLQVAIQQDFDPGKTLRDIGGAEALSAMVAIIGMATAWMGPLGAAATAAAGAASFKEMFAGAARSITATLAANDISLANIAEEEEFVHSFFGVNVRELEDMNINLMGRGKHQSSTVTAEVHIKDMIADGYWVDYTQIPSLNTDQAHPVVSQRDVSDWLFKVVLANLVSTIWKKQATYIVSIPMTEEECNNNRPGNGDHRMKLCKDGRGYFLQRLVQKKSAFGATDDISALPEFWGHMEDKYGITPHDAIDSSVEAFKSGGFDFTAEGILGNIMDVRGSQNIDAGPRFMGLWTLPVCDLAAKFADDGLSLDEWMQYVEGPDFNYVEDIGTGAACYCMTATDKNGKQFRDYYPIDPRC